MKLHEQKICYLKIVSEAKLDLVTHTTFQELLLTPFHLHEILGLDILSSEKHFCYQEISEILLCVRGLEKQFHPTTTFRYFLIFSTIL